MKWREACAIDLNGVAYRKPSCTDPECYYGHPANIGKNKWGDPECISVGGSKLTFEDADRCHDWQPFTRTDAITALGNVSKQREPEPPALSRGPLEAYMEDE
jgi:hypothetical protein